MLSIGSAHNPFTLRAIAASKKRNDGIDAGKIAECLRCEFHPNANGIHRDSGSASHAA
jgi:hypothetical protein